MAGCWPLLAMSLGASAMPVLHYTRPCVNEGGGSRDISAAITIDGAHHTWQLCEGGWHHAVSTDLVSWRSLGVDLDEWPSGFVVAADDGRACAGFLGADGAGVSARCAAAVADHPWTFGAERPWFRVDFYRPLPLDPFRPFRDSDGRYYIGVAMDGCNGTTRAAPCDAGGTLQLWSSASLDGPWNMLPRPMLATNQSLFAGRSEAHELVTVEFLGFGGGKRALLNNAYFARGSTEYFLGTQENGGPLDVEHQWMLDFGEFAPRRDGRGTGLGALNDSHVNDPSGGRFAMARCFGSGPDTVRGDGRRICVGWVNGGSDLGTPNATSFSTQSVPREVFAEGARLLQAFPRELRTLRTAHASTRTAGVALEGGLLVEVRATFRAAASAVEKFGFFVLGEAEVFVDPLRRLACVDATHMGNAEVRCGPVLLRGDVVTIHAIADHSVVTVLVDDGATAITAAANPALPARLDVTPFAPPAVSLSADVWRLDAPAHTYA